MTIAAGLVLALGVGVRAQLGVDRPARRCVGVAAARATPPDALARVPLPGSSLARRLRRRSRRVGALRRCARARAALARAGDVGRRHRAARAARASRRRARQLRERNGVLVATLGLGLLALSLVGGAAAGREGSVRAVGRVAPRSAAVAGLAAAGGRSLAPGAGLGSRRAPLRGGRRRDEDGLRGRAVARADRRRARRTRSCVRRAAARLPAGRRSRDRGNLDAADERAADRGGDRRLRRAASRRRLHRASCRQRSRPSSPALACSRVSARRARGCRPRRSTAWRRGGTSRRRARPVPRSRRCRPCCSGAGTCRSP